jgi:hypothetical protein
MRKFLLFLLFLCTFLISSGLFAYNLIDESKPVRIGDHYGADVYFIPSSVQRGLYGVYALLAYDCISEDKREACRGVTMGMTRPADGYITKVVVEFNCSRRLFRVVYKEIDDLNGYSVDRVDLSAAGAWGWKSVDEELPYLVKAYTMTCYGGLF